MKHVLLLGANGQVGWELQRALAPLGTLTVCNRQDADLATPLALESLVDRVQPDVIVNAGAYTAVDKAESDVANTRRVNADAVAALARAASKAGAWLVHYSTDYVFNGQGSEPFVESAPTGPLGVYGKTKLEGEDAIRQSGCRHLILRTSWVYAARGHNFPKTMLRLGKERETLNVVADQVGAPTSAELIADVTAFMLQRLAQDTEMASTASGTYHLVASGYTTWHAFAQFIFSEAIRAGATLAITPERVAPILSAQYPTPAQRPANSRLANDKLQQTFGLALPHWEYHARRMINELVDQGTV
ncbi:dTDP-4-dehydrorhamnose reductase [Pseudomonas putida]|uniref:dTDP-4-dehydrorhamnose reductase n=1 Tax=Pseudomonas putida TaxID=303 RepID=UPI00125EF0A9|nr:dTDP-4-dehydrorhamnose reductase [Pseudomonas putida]KAB5619169.1 dTDP-4-dehydrorhamnose reductase [Pseudomonas putida]